MPNESVLAILLCKNCAYVMTLALLVELQPSSTHRCLPVYHAGSSSSCSMTSSNDDDEDDEAQKIPQSLGLGCHCLKSPWAVEPFDTQGHCSQSMFNGIQWGSYKVSGWDFIPSACGIGWGVEVVDLSWARLFKVVPRTTTCFHQEWESQKELCPKELLCGLGSIWKWNWGIKSNVLH